MPWPLNASPRDVWPAWVIIWPNERQPAVERVVRRLPVGGVGLRQQQQPRLCRRRARENDRFMCWIGNDLSHFSSRGWAKVSCGVFGTINPTRSSNGSCRRWFPPNGSLPKDRPPFLSFGPSWPLSQTCSLPVLLSMRHGTFPSPPSSRGRRSRRSQDRFESSCRK